MTRPETRSDIPATDDRGRADTGYDVAGMLRIELAWDHFDDLSRIAPGSTRPRRRFTLL